MSPYTFLFYIQYDFIYKCMQKSPNTNDLHIITKVD